MSIALAILGLHLLQTPLSEPYRWRSVQIVGGGFVDGIVFHPTARDVRYARTDIGGAYRWDAGVSRWMSMLDWVPYEDLNWMGVESIAVDPHDPRRVYLACGTYTSPSTPDGAILRSVDGGRTFAAARVPIKFGGNEDGRGNGERMSVDPFDGSRLLLGTRDRGLWVSEDGAVDWRRVDSFPADRVTVTLFDPVHRGVAFAAAATVTGTSVFRSVDGGRSWSPVAGTPEGLQPTHMVFDSEGALWITYGDRPGPSRMTRGGVWKLKDGSWTETTPEKGAFGYAAVGAGKGAVIVSTFSRPGGEQIFRSTDGGQKWRKVIGGKETFDARKAPYVARTGIHWLFDVEIDPFDPNHAVFTTGYGGHETFDLTHADRGEPVHWQAMATGIEESVALALASPTKGPPLISAIGDYGGFVHQDLDRPAPEGNFTTPHFGNTTDVAVGDFAPKTIVRVGRSSGSGREANLGFSLDGGRSWRPPISTPPNAREGQVAVSPDGGTWVWSLKTGAYRTNDYGSSWTSCEGLPVGLRVVADRTSPALFYAIDLFEGKFYVSTDAARSFRETELGFKARRGNRGDARGGQDRIYSAPGRANDLWIAAFDGLYHAAPARPFTKLPNVSEIHAFGFGRAAPMSHSATLYLVGVVGGVRGVFRSTDEGLAWRRINDEAHQWGLVLQVTGDPKKFGRVYVGTHGRGVFYGDRN